MTKKEAAQILAILKAAYPNFYKDMTSEEAQGTVSVWSMQFADISADIVLMAVNKLISTNKFPPTIAEVKDRFISIHWEAYEKLYEGFYSPPLSGDEARLYKRIYDETERYKHHNRIEPTVAQMIGAEKLKQLKDKN